MSLTLPTIINNKESLLEDESLGMSSWFDLNTNFLSVTNGNKECIFSPNLPEDLDAGRESLGILKYDELEFSSLISPIEKPNFNMNAENVSSINNTNNTSSKFLYSIINQGFLWPDNNRSRCSSCPLKLKDCHQQLKSPACLNKSKSLAIDDEDVLKDIVLEKIINNSMKNNAEDVFLDCTPQPDWPEGFDSNDIKKVEKKTININTEKEFKKSDNMFPEPMSLNQSDCKSSNFQEIPDSTTNQSNNAQDMINNLSIIFNSSNLTEQQKREGKELLHNLAAILNASKQGQQNEDSGNSSILEIPIKNESSKKVKSSIPVSTTPKRLSQSLCLPIKKNEVSSGSSNESELICFQSNGASLKKSFKTKCQPPKSAMKRTPLIAVVPVHEMKKNTPNSFNKEKLQKKICTVATSTPKNIPKNTNEMNSKMITNQSKFLMDSSRYNKSRSYSNDSIKLYDSLNSPKTKENNSPTSNANSKSIRRNSISDVVLDRKRNNSLVKPTGIMAVLPKIRENLMKNSSLNELKGMSPISKKGKLMRSKENIKPYN